MMKRCKMVFPVHIVFTLLLCTVMTMPVYSQQEKLLAGQLLGTSPSTNNGLREHAFDGDFNTYFSASVSSHAWVGLDLGSRHVITRISFAPRMGTSYSSRMLLGLFEGANNPDFLDAVPLYLIDQSPASGVLTTVDIHVSRGFRYVRYCGPADSKAYLSELAFYGYEGEGDDSRFYQLTNLPTLSYHTLSGNEPMDKVNELEAQMCLIYDEGTLIQEYPILARVRGNASAGFPKKPYRIKFNDGKSHHIMKGGRLESPAKAKKWTLINNYGDKTLMRNMVSFEISRRLQMPYTPYCQPVDVIVNGEYKGCYQLCDQITIDPHRVPIVEMEPSDVEEPFVTGGYLIEVDAYAYSEKSWFTSSRGVPVTIKEPGEDDIVPAQSEYIRNYFNLLESALWSAQYTDSTYGYRSRLDVESFLRHFLVGEYSGNTDTYWSVYMYKNREEDLFHVAPCWDFDLAFNNDNRIYPVCDKPDWIFRSGGSGASGMADFVNRILSDKAASRRLETLWAEMRDTGVFTAEGMQAYVDSVAGVLDQSQRLNFLRWPILNQYVHQNAFALGSYEAEVGVVRTFVAERLEWLDTKLRYGMEIPEDKLYEIDTAKDLMDFARVVNQGGLTAANAVLTADIDMKAYKGSFNPIGTEQFKYAGTFDGRGHTISNLYVSSTSDYVGLFGVVSGGADIRNLTLDATCYLRGNAFVGLIGGSHGSGTVCMSRLGNEGTVVAKNQNAGGIIGCNMNSLSTYVMDACYVSGCVQGGYESAALTGWAGSGGQLSNCYSIASVSGVEGSSSLLRGGWAYIDNCYDVNGQPGLPGISSEELASGWLCYSLNGSSADDPVSFFQTLGEDLYPVLNSTHARVYYINNVYTNVPEGGNGLTQPTLVGTEVEAIYGTDGKRRTRLMPGVNIVRMTDGTSRKLYVKP